MEKRKFQFIVNRKVLSEFLSLIHIYIIDFFQKEWTFRMELKSFSALLIKQYPCYLFREALRLVSYSCFDSCGSVWNTVFFLVSRNSRVKSWFSHSNVLDICLTIQIILKVDTINRKSSRLSRNYTIKKTYLFTLYSASNSIDLCEHETLWWFISWFQWLAQSIERMKFFFSEIQNIRRDYSWVHWMGNVLKEKKQK